MKRLSVLFLLCSSCIFRSQNCDDLEPFTIEPGIYTASVDDDLRGELGGGFDELPVGDVTLEVGEQVATLSYVNADGEQFEVAMTLGEQGWQRVEF